MDKLQFYHQIGNHRNGTKYERTFAVNVPDSKKIIHLINYKLVGLEQHILIDLGIAKVNPKDHYVKKIGRQISLQRSIPRPFKIVNVAFFALHTEVSLVSDNISIVLQLKEGREHAHLISAWIYE